MFLSSNRPGKDLLYFAFLAAIQLANIDSSVLPGLRGPSFGLTASTGASGH
jgi:hypothetical protein